jgi:hypothetical protein
MLGGIFGAMVGLFATILPMSHTASAAQGEAREQYKVVQQRDFQDGLEPGLNRMADEGWKVRGTMGDMVILFK